MSDLHDPWTPLARQELEEAVAHHASHRQHLWVLYWVIWLSLLSAEELWQLGSCEETSEVKTQAELVHELSTMKQLGLIDNVTLREPHRPRLSLYYATDLGLYLYLSAVRPSPPLTIARLAKAYPIGRAELLARLARPQIHLALCELVTRLICEGASLGGQLMSYQQPWQQTYTFGSTHRVLQADAALLMKHAEDSPYAFLVHVDPGSHPQAERQVEHLLTSLLSLRQQMLLSRRHWPAVLILLSKDRLAIWTHLLVESSLKQGTQPLAGAMTTLDALHEGVSTPIWWDLGAVAHAQNAERVPLLPFSALLRDPASEALAEQFSHQRRFSDLLRAEAAFPPPPLRPHLTRYVGSSLTQEATHVTRAHLEERFAKKRKSRHSLEATGLLTLALTAAEKDLLTLASQHPLLDVPTFQTVLHPGAGGSAIKAVQATITHLFQLGLIETRLWLQGHTPLSQQRYLLTPVALKFLALRHGVPFSSYFVLPKYHRDDDEQLDRQWGTRGLDRQMEHTNALYTFMRELVQGTAQRGEGHLIWKSAHEAARWYRDSLSHESGHARPDAEVVFVPAGGEEAQIFLLEYDRGTTVFQYTRKFTAYLDYQQATGTVLPLLLVVTPSQPSRARIQRVLDALPGTLPIIILLERDLLAHGLSLILPHLPASSPDRSP